MQKEILFKQESNGVLADVMLPCAAFVLEIKGAAVIVGCEESQAVTIELRALGIEAFSCDTEPCSGGHPEWHLQMDIFEAIKMRKWDAGIFFPPCTYLTVTANKWMKPEFEKRFPTRKQDRIDAIKFFKDLYNSDIPLIAIENPIGIMSTQFRKPDQIIQPWQFGDPTPKSTCLWLKGFPKLIHTNIVTPEFIIGKRDGKKYSLVHYMTVKKDKKERSRLRSKTFPGIAKAMGEQWGRFVLAAAPLISKTNGAQHPAALCSRPLLPRTFVRGRSGWKQRALLYAGCQRTTGAFAAGC